MATVIYARKSTESEDRQVQSLDDQVRALTELAKREGIPITEIITESRSAKTPYSRPEFQRMILGIERGQIDAVLTWAVSRLSRNLIDGGIVAHLLQTGKLRFIRTPERVYRPEDNVLILSIENGMATSYLQDLSRNVKRGMQGKADRGWRPGKAPIGYKNNPLTREIDPDPSCFDLVQKGWKMLLSGGYTLAEAHRELVNLGLKGTQRGSQEQPVGKSVLYKTFMNPFYAGYFAFRGQLLPGKHKPMISMADYEAVQRQLARIPERRYHHREKLYAGLLRCGKCGCQIVADTRRKYYKRTDRTVEYTYYHCTGARGCSKRGIAEKDITTKLQETVKRFKTPHSFTEWAMAGLTHVAENDTVVIAQSAARIDHDLMAHQQRLGRMRDMRVDGELSREEYAELKSDLEQQIKTLQDQRANLLSEDERILRYIREKLEVAEQAANYEELCLAAKRALILSMGRGHCLTLGNLQIRLNPIIRKIAAFGPLRNGSEIPKPGDSLASFPAWCGFLHSIRNVARKQLLHEAEEEAANPPGRAKSAP